MNNERDDWAQASETVLIFDQWMRAIVGTLRAERGATINQFWLLLLISERPQQSAATAAATLGLNYTTVAACACIIGAFTTGISVLYVVGAFCCGFCYGGVPVGTQLAGGCSLVLR